MILWEKAYSFKKVHFFFFDEYFLWVKATPLPSPPHCSRRSAWPGSTPARRETSRPFQPEDTDCDFQPEDAECDFPIASFLSLIKIPPLGGTRAAPAASRSCSTPLVWKAEPLEGVTSSLPTRPLENFKGCKRLFGGNHFGNMFVCWMSRDGRIAAIQGWDVVFCMRHCLLKNNSK